MKNMIFWKLSPGLFVVLIPLLGGSQTEPMLSSAPDTANTNQEPAAVAGAVTNAPSAEAAEEQLENAPGQIVAANTLSPGNVALNGPAAKVVRLAQAGLDESVILSFVANSSGTFDLSADAIVYFNDLGISGTIVTSMIQHDQAIRTASFNSTGVSTPPPDANVPVQPSATAPDSASGTTGVSDQPMEMTNDATAGEPPGGSSGYFYSSLSPYGNWIYITGYGLCWQPSAVCVNRGWQPYCNNGYWVYSDCGWYWASDYSWGWAPFHYGRWFRHSHWGWCWAPDTTWGPSWVSWRYAGGYCGWAPLPPTACFTPGAGFTCFGHSVGFSFNFGLAANAYTFVPTSSFYGRRPYYYRVPARNVDQFFKHTVVINQIVQDNNRVVNKGIPVNHIAAATRSNIRTVHIHGIVDPNIPGTGRMNRDGTLAIYRPDLPMPVQHTLLVGEGLRAGSPGLPVTSMVRSDFGAAQPLPHSLPTVASPAFNNQPYAAASVL